MNSAVKVIIDCDPGVDDAIALLLAFAARQEVEVLGITCVAGNVPLTSTVSNAHRIRQIAHRGDVPVLAGCSRPIMKKVGYRSSAHGEDGLGGVNLPDASAPDSETNHAVDFIIEQVRKAPGEVILCPIGPLTNIAMALIKNDGLAENIKEIILMGGAAFCPGNSTPVAEFNVFVDPHAAQVVFDSGIPITMFGLDVTSKACIGAEWLTQLAGRSSRCAAFAAEMMQSYGRKDLHLHDPCVIAFLIRPELFAGVDAHVSVMTDAGASFGQTIASVKERHMHGRTPNCKVITDVDSAALFDMLLDRIGRLP